jgi:hypothetical protein
MVIIPGDFYSSDQQIEKKGKDLLYPQIIKSIIRCTDSIMLMFSAINLSYLVNYDYIKNMT